MVKRALPDVAVRATATLVGLPAKYPTTQVPSHFCRYLSHIFCQAEPQGTGEKLRAVF